ncbi:MAG: hypothetical protein KAH18_08030 [Psychromonas sp.]|nr:hypothetical protein [Psychromonas sp.]
MFLHVYDNPAYPDIEIIFIEEAKWQDGSVFDQISPILTDKLLFGDQAYKGQMETTLS